MTAKKLTNNSLINLSYQILSIIIALIFIPFSIKILGVELFGVYTLSITFLILFNYFNFGIAPSTTKELAIRLGKGDTSSVNSLVLNSIILMLLISIPFFVFFYCFGENITSIFFTTNLELQLILSNFFMQIGIISPLVFLVLVQRAILESIQLFYITSFVKMILNSVVFISPSILLFDFFDTLDIFKIISLIYIIAILFQFIYIIKFFLIRYPISFDKSDQRKLISVGFYVMISGILMALLTYFDRYYIAMQLSATGVSFYTVGFDTVARINIIIWSVIAVLFPALSSWYANGEIVKIKKYLAVGFKMSFFIILFLSSLLILFSYEILYFWISKDFAQSSSFLFKLLSFGIIFSSISIISSRALIAFGKEKKLAYILLLEFIFYFFILSLLVNYFSLIGVVISFIIKSIIQFFILFYYMNKSGLNFVISLTSFKYIKFFLIFLGSVIMVFIASDISNTQYKLIFLFFYSFLYFYLWNRFLIQEEFKQIIYLIKKKVDN